MGSEVQACLLLVTGFLQALFAYLVQALFEYPPAPRSRGHQAVGDEVTVSGHWSLVILPAIIVTTLEYLYIVLIVDTYKTCKMTARSVCTRPGPGLIGAGANAVRWTGGTTSYGDLWA